MKTETASSHPPTIENFNVPLDTRFFIDHDREEVEGTIQDALFIIYYARGELSMGLLAEMKGMSYREAEKWLIDQGIPTLRKPSEETKKRAFQYLQNMK